MTIPTPPPPQGAQTSHQTKSYDLDSYVFQTTSRERNKKILLSLLSSDALWSEYGPRAFPEAAVAISDALNDYNARMGQLGHKGGGESGILNGGDSAGGVMEGLTTAINALPEMTEKKRYNCDHNHA